MQALVYRRSIPRYLACQAAGRLFRRRFFPALAPLGLEERDFAPPEDWVAVKVSLCGICGSDLGLLRGNESYLMEPYASFPAVLGHEVLGVVTEAPAASGFSEGQRVVVEPMLCCEARGLEPCGFCAQGQYNLCEHFGDGNLQPGMVLGYNASAGGGMAEYMAAHPSRLVAVPEGLEDERAVLTDPLASALQPALENFPRDNDLVIIYGAGVIGQFILRALRALGCKARIILAARHAFQRELAQIAGADLVLMSPDRKTLGQAVNARLLPTTLGGGNLEGGADLFFDCVGSSRSMQDGLLSLRGNGRYVLVATAGTIKNVDFSPLWHRQLTMRGSNCYARVPHQGRSVRAYELALSLLADQGFPAQGLLTHVLPLAQWREAFAVAFDKRGRQSVKVALRP